MKLDQITPSLKHEDAAFAMSYERTRITCLVNLQWNAAEEIIEDGRKRRSIRYMHSMSPIDTFQTQGHAEIDLWWKGS